MGSYENSCSYGESLCETFRKLCEDVNKIKSRGWQPQGGVTIAYRGMFVAEQRLVKSTPRFRYEYDIVWAYASNISKARIELEEIVENRKERGWKNEGEVAELHRVGIYSKNSEMWYLAQVMIRT